MIFREVTSIFIGFSWIFHHDSGVPSFLETSQKKTEVRELPEGTHTKSVESPSFPKETCLQMVGFHTSMLVYQMDPDAIS